MRIKRVEIKNFRKLIGPIILDDLKSGINVISGDNEEGKSTLLLALRAAFCQRHNTTAQSVKSFLPYSSSLRPEVHVDFDFKNGFYQISKGFVTKPTTAKFRSPEGTFEGSEAEDKIRELFMLPSVEKSRRGAELDAGLFGLVWLEQATAERGLQTTEYGKEGLMRLVERDLASILGGGQGRQLVQSVTDSYLKYFTEERGNERGPLKQLREKRDQAQSAYEQCLKKFDLHKMRLEQLAEKEEALAKHKRERTLENAQQKVREQEKSLEQLKELTLKIQSARREEKSVKLELDAAQEKAKKRLDLAAKLLRADDRLKQIGELLAARNAELHSQSRKLKELEDSQSASELEVASLEKRCLAEELRETQERLQIDLANLDSQLQGIAAVQQSIRDLTVEAEKIQIDQKMLSILKQLHLEKERAQMRREAVATRVIVKPDKTNKVSIDGVPVAPNEEFKLIKATHLTLEGWGSIDITPGGDDINNDDAEKKYAKALKTANLESVEQAEELLARRKELLSEIEQLKRTSAVDSAPTLEAKRAKLQLQLQNLPNNQEASTVSTNEPLGELRTRRDKLVAKRNEIRSLLDNEKAKLSQTQIDVAQFQTEMKSVEANKSECLKESEALTGSEEAEKEAIDSIQRKLIVAQSEVSVHSSDLEKLEKTNVEKLHADAVKEVARIDGEQNVLKTAITQLSFEIAATGETGLGEELERLEGEEKIAQQAFVRIERDARATRLLYETLIDAQQKAKQEFFEPVMQRLNPYLRQLFSDSKVQLDSQSIEITNFERSGRAERFDDLSIGTREQLSVLVRIAVAQYLKEKEQPSVVILDDALVYTDDRRMEIMKNILMDLSSELQVIILTCKARDYADFPAANYIAFKSEPMTIVK